MRVTHKVSDHHHHLHHKRQQQAAINITPLISPVPDGGCNFGQTILTTSAWILSTFLSLCLISGSDRKTTVATITDDSNMARRHTPGHNPQRRGETEGKHAGR
jgi:hypothetical protein